jgi:hypothetical protein
MHMEFIKELNTSCTLDKMKQIKMTANKNFISFSPKFESWFLNICIFVRSGWDKSFGQIFFLKVAAGKKRKLSKIGGTALYIDSIIAIQESS